MGGNDVLAFVLAACIAQTDWSGIPARHDLTDKEMSEARDALARRLRAYGVEELARIADTMEVRRGEGAPVVFIEVVTQDGQNRADTRKATWTRLVWAGDVSRPGQGWIEVDGDQIEEAAARIPDEELRRHVLAVARQAREQTARPRSQVVRLAVVPCRWVECEAGGESYEALLASGQAIEEDSLVRAWVKAKLGDAERLLAAGNIDGADHAARWVLTAQPGNAAAGELLARIQASQHEILAQVATPDRDGDDPLEWTTTLGVGAFCVAMLVILALLTRKSKDNAP